MTDPDMRLPFKRVGTIEGRFKPMSDPTTDPLDVAHARGYRDGYREAKAALLPPGAVIVTAERLALIKAAFARIEDKAPGACCNKAPRARHRFWCPVAKAIAAIEGPDHD